MTKTKYKVYSRSGAQKIQFICDEQGRRPAGADFEFDFFCRDPLQVCKPRTACPLDCHHR